MDKKPGSWEERITLFAGYLIDQNKKSGTVKSYISGIKAILKEDGVTVNENRCLLASLTKACKLKNDLVRTRLPIQKNLLNLLIRSTFLFYMEKGQPFLAKLYTALFATAYYGMFRVGELTTGDHPVKAVDVHIGENKDKMLFILRTSKTHWKDVKPQLIKITASIARKNYQKKTKEEERISCPFAILNRYVKDRPTCKNAEEPFFVFSDGSVVKPVNMRNVMREILALQGFDASLYGCHSYRIGRSLDLLKLNFSVEQIRHLGRWRSNCVYKYLRN